MYWQSSNRVCLELNSMPIGVPVEKKRFWRIKAFLVKQGCKYFYTSP